MKKYPFFCQKRLFGVLRWANPILFFCFLWPTFKVSAQTRPNIILIFLDDLGYGDVGFNGSLWPTPSIDSLAASGAKLTQYRTMHVCTPARVALLTGQQPCRYGLEGRNFSLWDSMGLDKSAKLISHELREQGYVNGQFGKWQLGNASGYKPLSRGFDVAVGMYGGAYTYYEPLSKQSAFDWHEQGIWKRVGDIQMRTTIAAALPYHNVQSQMTSKNRDEYAVDKLLDFVNVNHNCASPFFAYVALTTPHDPMAIDSAYFNAALPFINTIPPFSHEDSLCAIRGGMMMLIDEQINRIVTHLDSLGERDNTLIILTSDNGGVNNGDCADNGGLRLGKGYDFDGGIRVPFIASWPGTIPAQQTIDEFAHITDIFPLLTYVSGGEPDREMDGLNIYDLLVNNAPSPHSTIILTAGLPNVKAITDKQYKAITSALNFQNYGGTPNGPFLYDLILTPNEIGTGSNKYNANQGIYNQLMGILTDFETQKCLTPFQQNSVQPPGYQLPFIIGED